MPEVWGLVCTSVGLTFPCPELTFPCPELTFPCPELRKWGGNAKSVRVGVHLCGPHVSVSGTHVSVSGAEEMSGQCRKCEGWCAPLWASRLRVRRWGNEGTMPEVWGLVRTSVGLTTLCPELRKWGDNAGSVRVGAYLCGPHDSVSGTEEMRGQCRKCEGWCAPLWASRFRVRNWRRKYTGHGGPFHNKSLPGKFYVVTGACIVSLLWMSPQYYTLTRTHKPKTSLEAVVRRIMTTWPAVCRSEQRHQSVGRIRYLHSNTLACSPESLEVPV